MDQLYSMTDATALDVLKRMKKIRQTEETIAAKYSEGKMRCPTHLCTGQEAVSAVSGVLITNTDFAVSTHRAHGHYLGKGGDLNKMIAEIYGKKTGCSKGKGGSMHLIDKSVGFMGSTAIVGGTIPIGVGLGLSIQLKGTNQISCVFLGDGSTEEGVFYESVSFAKLKNLPVLFICENNLYSVYSPLSVRQPEDRNIQKMVDGMGISGKQGDGNNPNEVYQLIEEALQNIRSGGGPVFLEFFTYRWREHCGPNFDNDIGYRTEAEFQSWKSRDPIIYFENELRQRNIINDRTIDIMELDIAREIQEAFVFAEGSPFPEPEDAYTDLYREE
jgi:TPP-dependent pyruvate/acetoin dehydrogenase alpha subunit